jgi:hypothetical protein
MVKSARGDFTDEVRREGSPAASRRFKEIQDHGLSSLGRENGLIYAHLGHRLFLSNDFGRI